VYRYNTYRDLFKNHLSGKDLDLIRKAAHYCQPVGNDRFRREIEEKYGVKLGQLNRGRPKNTYPQVVKK
jgi:putative transposase